MITSMLKMYYSIHYNCQHGNEMNKNISTLNIKIRKESFFSLQGENTFRTLYTVVAYKHEQNIVGYLVIILVRMLFGKGKWGLGLPKKKLI